MPRWLPWVVLLLAPILVSWPALVGFSADPIYVTSGLLSGGRPGWIPGLLNLDLNVGVTTQALGHLAAEQWLQGEVPWWNPYSGIGMPLAGEMQASALFLPFVLLLHFANGPFILKLSLQMLAGLSTYGLLRSLAISRAPALIGGLMFALSGIFAWLGHGPVMPVAFLPLFLLGIERARSGGFALVAVAVAGSLYAGFPETAYLDGLMALAWAGLRLVQAPDRLRFAGRVFAGGLIGVFLAAPALWSFANMLFHSSVENHAVTYAPFDPVPDAMPASVPAAWLFPYIFGPLLAYPDRGGLLAHMAQYLGGYIGVLPLGLALLGLWGPTQRPLRWVLFAWIVFCIGGVANLPGVTQAIYALPMTRQTILVRYLNPSWQIACIVLAVLAIEDWRSGKMVARVRSAVGVLLLAMAGASVVLAWPLMRAISADTEAYWVWPLGSLLWAAVSALAGFWLLSRPQTPRLLLLLAAVLALDSAAMFALPMLAGPRDASIDHAAVDFLKANTGLQRFYALGPYRPNYGAYFETPQLNHEYLPIPANWVAYIRNRLDPSASPIMFRGDEPVLSAGVPSHGEQMVRHLPAFAALGVRYVVTHAGIDPFVLRFEAGGGAGHGVAHEVKAGGELAGSLRVTDAQPGPVDGIGVALGTYMGKANGHLSAELCAEAGCAVGTFDLAAAVDNMVAVVPIAPPLSVRPGEAVRWRFRHEGGSAAVAIWLPPASQEGPRLTFTRRPDRPPPPRVYRDRIMDIYELPDAAPYFEALDGPCTLHVASRMSLEADCTASSRLVRRELHFSGWRVSVNGESQDIAPFDEVMQKVILPAGHSIVAFDYAPPYARLCWVLAALAIVALAVGKVFAGRRRSA